MMMKTVSALLVGAALALAGCSSGSSGNGSTATGSSAGAATLTASQQEKVDRAASVAREVRANPDNAEGALRRAGLSEQQYEDLMYEIASDPAMSRAYNAKMGQ